MQSKENLQSSHRERTLLRENIGIVLKHDREFVRERERERERERAANQQTVKHETTRKETERERQREKNMQTTQKGEFLTVEIPLEILSRFRDLA
jgi:hypothetical protein